MFYFNLQARYSGVFTDDMIKGLSAGFGFFVALIVLICLIWYCCCAENNNTVRTIDIKSENTRVSNRNNPRTRPSQNDNNQIRTTSDNRNGRRLYS